MLWRKKKADKEDEKKTEEEEAPPYFILMVLEQPGAFTLAHPSADFVGEFNKEINQIPALPTSHGKYRPVGVLYRKIKTGGAEP